MSPWGKPTKAGFRTVVGRRRNHFMPRRSIWKGSFVDAFSSKMRSKRENISSKFLFLLVLLIFGYLICMKMGFMAYFLLVLSKVGVLLVGRALSFFFRKMGCPGGKTLALLFSFWALQEASASTPPFGNAVSPGREPELDLRLGPPGVQVEEPEGLSPAERQLMERLTRDGRDNLSLDDIQAMVGLKEDIVTRISQLDPHPFWTEQRARIISSYVVTPRGEEYSLRTLEKIATELGDPNTLNHYFLKRMRKLRKDFELLGRFF